MGVSLLNVVLTLQHLLNEMVCGLDVVKVPSDRAKGEKGERRHWAKKLVQ
jgi:hypothetical protein